jgi:hypothetical protein
LEGIGPVTCPIVSNSADSLQDIVVGAEEIVGWRLGIDGAVDILYNTVIVDGDLERDRYQCD